MKICFVIFSLNTVFSHAVIFVQCWYPVIWLSLQRVKDYSLAVNTIMKHAGKVRHRSEKINKKRSSFHPYTLLNSSLPIPIYSSLLHYAQLLSCVLHRSITGICQILKKILESRTPPSTLHTPVT